MTASHKETIVADAAIGHKFAGKCIRSGKFAADDGQNGFLTVNAVCVCQFDLTGGDCDRGITGNDVVCGIVAGEGHLIRCGSVVTGIDGCKDLRRQFSGKIIASHKTVVSADCQSLRGNICRCIIDLGCGESGNGFGCHIEGLDSGIRDVVAIGGIHIAVHQREGHLNCMETRHIIAGCGFAEVCRHRCSVDGVGRCQFGSVRHDQHKFRILRGVFKFFAVGKAAGTHHRDGDRCPVDLTGQCRIGQEISVCVHQFVVISGRIIRQHQSHTGQSDSGSFHTGAPCAECTVRDGEFQFFSVSGGISGKAVIGGIQNINIGTVIDFVDGFIEADSDLPFVNGESGECIVQAQFIVFRIADRQCAESGDRVRSRIVMSGSGSTEIRLHRAGNRAVAHQRIAGAVGGDETQRRVAVDAIDPRQFDLAFFNRHSHIFRHDVVCGIVAGEGHLVDGGSIIARIGRGERLRGKRRRHEVTGNQAVGSVNCERLCGKIRCGIIDFGCGESGNGFLIHCEGRNAVHRDDVTLSHIHAVAVLNTDVVQDRMESGNMITGSAETLVRRQIHRSEGILTDQCAIGGNGQEICVL